MKRLMLLIFPFLLASCAQFENGVACEIDGSGALFYSSYYRFHIGATIKQAHADVMCQKAREAALAITQQRKVQ